MPHVALIPALSTTVEPLRAHVDNYLEVKHRLTSKVGMEPVEDGTEVTDHVVAMPAELMLEGMVSDLTQAGNARPAESWAAMQRLHQEAEPMEVITPWGVYGEMVIERLDSRQEGGGMVFELNLRRILRVNLSGSGVPTRFTLPESPARNRPGVIDLGSVSPPVIDSLSDEWGRGIALASVDTQVQNAILKRELGSEFPPAPEPGITLERILNRAGDLTARRSLSGVASRLIGGLSNNGFPGLENELDRVVRGYGFSGLPNAVARIGGEARKLSRVLARTGSPRLPTDVAIQNAVQLAGRFDLY